MHLQVCAISSSVAGLIAALRTQLNFLREPPSAKINFVLQHQVVRSGLSLLSAPGL